MARRVTCSCHSSVAFVPGVSIILNPRSSCPAEGIRTFTLLSPRQRSGSVVLFSRYSLNASKSVKLFQRAFES